MGFIFTIGDEETPQDLTQADLDKTYGDRQEIVISNDELLMSLGYKYHVFHIMIEQGSHMRYNKDKVLSKWGSLLGQNAIPLADSTKLAEVLVSLMQLKSGETAEKVVDSWTESKTRDVVLRATKNLRDGVRTTGLLTF